MSMPFICGAAPSSLTVPLILPSPAALTLWPEIRAKPQARTTADSTTAWLYRFFIKNLLGNCPLADFHDLLLSRRGVWINRFQAKLFGHFFLFALLRHQRPQIEHQVPSLIRLDVVGKRRHGSAVQPGHENLVDVLIGIATLWPGAFGEVIRSNRPAEIIGQRSGGGSI